MTSLPVFSVDTLNELAAPGIRRLVVGLSGGMDSVVLLHALQQQPLGKPLHAIHVHHGLQSAADDFADFCQDCCAALGVPIEIHRVNVSSRGSIEAKARDARYAVFRKTLEHGDLLLLGHHEDDQVETIVLNQRRGSDRAGLFGMPDTRAVGAAWLKRPFLQVPRHQLEAYARQHRLRWCEDPTNQDLRMDRNYVRHVLLPRMEARSPGISRRLIRTSQRDATAMAEAEALARQDRATLIGRSGGLLLPGFLQLADARRRQLLRTWFADSGLCQPRRVAISAFLARLQQGEAARLQQPGYDVCVFDGHLHLVAPVAKPLPEGLTVSSIQGQSECPLVPNEYSEGKGVSIARLAGLTLGYRRPGDHIRIRHRRTLKSWLQELGVPPWLRDVLPVVRDGHQVVAIAGLPDWQIDGQVADGYHAGSGEAGWMLNFCPRQ